MLLTYLDNLIVYYCRKRGKKRAKDGTIATIRWIEESKLSRRWKNIIVPIEMEKDIFRKKFIPMRMKEEQKKKSA